jgi:hypothetical protein
MNNLHLSLPNKKISSGNYPTPVHDILKEKRPRSSYEGKKKQRFGNTYFDI